MSTISLLYPPLLEHAKMEAYHPFMNVVVAFVLIWTVCDIFLCFLLVFLFCVLRGAVQRLGVAYLDRCLLLVPTNNPIQIVLSNVEVAGSGETTLTEDALVGKGGQVQRPPLPLFGCWCWPQPIDARF